MQCEWQYQSEFKKYLDLLQKHGREEHVLSFMIKSWLRNLIFIIKIILFYFYVILNLKITFFWFLTIEDRIC